MELAIVGMIILGIFAALTVSGLVYGVFLMLAEGATDRQRSKRAKTGKKADAKRQAAQAKEYDQLMSPL